MLLEALCNITTFVSLCHEGLLLLRHPHRQCWNIHHYRRTAPRRIPRRCAISCYPFQSVLPLSLLTSLTHHPQLSALLLLPSLLGFLLRSASPFQPYSYLGLSV